ncbi:hypothetical protein OGATHE_005728 [Ogataea polymorpha]|uniref:Uncharacterized protein n=1 Tax=Ogataea polymorpha TaxID=460523 RepID=A0A9P8NTQ9_9ASCO|nr:hypothetical protein OGATHE_005728 [Ogataea polymorpha]
MMEVTSFVESPQGETSVTSAPTTKRPANPSMISSSSLEDHPPGSRDPVPGAEGGSRTSMSKLMYTGELPSRSLILSIIPWTPILSTSRAMILANFDSEVRNRGYFPGLASVVEWLRMALSDRYNWSRATLLSKGVIGTLPQSTILAQLFHTFNPSLYGEYAAENFLVPCLMASGPNREPGLYEIPVSKGAPRTTMSSSNSSSFSGSKQCCSTGRCP